MLRFLKISALAMILVLLGSLPVFATTTTYSTLAGFQAATTGLSTQDFESGSLNVLGDGSSTGTLGSLTFSGNVFAGAGFLQIATGFDTTSGSNYLGTDANTFFASDDFTVQFPSVTAFGLYLLVGGNLASGDFTLTTSVGNVLNSATAETTLGDGTVVYFVGLTSDTPFTSATLGLTTPGGTSDGPIWNVDDILTGSKLSTQPPPPAVPEPASLLLMGTGLAGIVRRIRKA